MQHTIADEYRGEYNLSTNVYRKTDYEGWRQWQRAGPRPRPRRPPAATGVAAAVGVEEEDEGGADKEDEGGEDEEDEGAVATGIRPRQHWHRD